MRIVVLLLLIGTILLGSLYWLTSYRSAFEADQACHQMILEKSIKGITIDCDHDIETKQWILYQKESEGKAATVLKRFRY
tara:strand:+ start:289 stop:528 length:240 start_codon:yes stop_codon:yes gene_type:complete